MSQNTVNQVELNENELDAVVGGFTLVERRVKVRSVNVFNLLPLLLPPIDKTRPWAE